jgi:hypothetical protein
LAITITIEGLAELQAAVARAESGLDEDIRAALLAAAEVVADRARATAPVRSGRLRGSIRGEAAATAADVVVDARNPRDGYPYPIRIERQQPFLAPAFAAAAEEAADKLEQVLDEIAAKWGGA